jgi:hypothetical protein
LVLGFTSKFVEKFEHWFELVKPSKFNSTLSLFKKKTGHKSKYVVKSKAVPLHAMVVLGGRGGIAPTHFYLGTRWG